MAKKTDIIDVMIDVHRGNLKVITQNGFFLLEDIKSGERVRLNEADIAPVVHGRWEQVDHDGSWRVDRCSICRRRMHYVDYDQPYRYCPNCGAKMDGDGNG